MGTCCGGSTVGIRVGTPRILGGIRLVISGYSLIAQRHIVWEDKVLQIFGFLIESVRLRESEGTKGERTHSEEGNTSPTIT